MGEFYQIFRGDLTPLLKLFQKIAEEGTLLKSFYKATLTLIQKLETPQKKKMTGASLVAQWLRIRLPMQGTQVRALVQEDPTCHGATKPMHHNY